MIPIASVDQVKLSWFESEQCWGGRWPTLPAGWSSNDPGVCALPAIPSVLAGPAFFDCLLVLSMIARMVLEVRCGLVNSKQETASYALGAARSAASPAVRRAHGIHPYPGMLARHIPRAVLREGWPGISAEPGITVLDPFCGAGTVLLEAQMAGLSSVGWDSNPLACLISRVKTQPVSPPALTAALNRVVDRAVRAHGADPPAVVNREYWYSDRASEGLSRLSLAVRELKPGPTNDLLRLALSRTAMQLSLANPRFPVPVKLRLHHYREGSSVYLQLQRHLTAAMTHDPIQHFESIAQQMAQAMAGVSVERPYSYRNVTVAEHDVRETADPTDRASIILTSPPYPGAQKYSRFSSLSLGWLGCVDQDNLRAFEDLQIGREHFHKAEYQHGLVSTEIAQADNVLSQVARDNPLRAHIGAAYLIEMRVALRQVVEILAPDGHLIMIVAPGRFCGRRFDTPQYLTCMARDQGLDLLLRIDDSIRYRRLLSSRNGNSPPIQDESILHFQKKQ